MVTESWLKDMWPRQVVLNMLWSMIFSTLYLKSDIKTPGGLWDLVLHSQIKSNATININFIFSCFIIKNYLDLWGMIMVSIILGLKAYIPTWQGKDKTSTGWNRIFLDNKRTKSHMRLKNHWCWTNEPALPCCTLVSDALFLPNSLAFKAIAEIKSPFNPWMLETTELF